MDFLDNFKYYEHTTDQGKWFYIDMEDVKDIEVCKNDLLQKLKECYKDINITVVPVITNRK